MNSNLPVDDVRRAYSSVRSELLDRIGPQGHWEGCLSTSALSTATAVMACQQVCRRDPAQKSRLQPLIDGGKDWLISHQNSDGGWGDTTQSFSNISTTMLVHAVFVATGEDENARDFLIRANRYIRDAGGIEAVLRRYGKDRTFSIPILTHCALAGTCDWKRVLALPFEFACLPARFYRTVRLPVVSYALPALIAIGQAIHVHRPSRNPLVRWLRERCRKTSLRILQKIQPSNGGFLEATPLTSFVTMSLASIGLHEHPVVVRGIQFIEASVRSDGSWPIDTNLSTWVTSLSIHALRDDLPEQNLRPLAEWLMGQQYRSIHPYTQADPGGWAWTDLPGGVPDADDTPGAILALLEISRRQPEIRQQVRESTAAGIHWLLKLQNRNGGWPTFCRGWGALPFDRSSCDITAHVLRALQRWLAVESSSGDPSAGVTAAIQSGLIFLENHQESSGSWLPLWFGNQYLEAEENPVYGTSRVLLAYEALDAMDRPAARRGIDFLKRAQNSDGGWGGGEGTPSSIEETGLALEALLATSDLDETVLRGLQWLAGQAEANRCTQTSPIGFYFAKLWYFEELYPLIDACAALRKATGLIDRMHNS